MKTKIDRLCHAAIESTPYRAARRKGNQGSDGVASRSFGVTNNEGKPSGEFPFSHDADGFCPRKLPKLLGPCLRPSSRSVLLRIGPGRRHSAASVIHRIYGLSTNAEEIYAMTASSPPCSRIAQCGTNYDERRASPPVPRMVEPSSFSRLIQ